MKKLCVWSKSYQPM